MKNNFHKSDIGFIRFGIYVGLGVGILIGLLFLDPKIGLIFGTLFGLITTVGGAIQSHNKKNNLK